MKNFYIFSINIKLIKAKLNKFKFWKIKYQFIQIMKIIIFLIYKFTQYLKDNNKIRGDFIVENLNNNLKTDFDL